MREIQTQIWVTSLSPVFVEISSPTDPVVIPVDLMHDRHDHLDHCHVQLRLQEMEVLMNHDHLDH